LKRFNVVVVEGIFQKTASLMAEKNNCAGITVCENYHISVLEVVTWIFLVCRSQVTKESVG
jgi:hypothetical protein